VRKDLKRFGIDEKMWCCEAQERGRWQDRRREGLMDVTENRPQRRRKAAMNYPDVSNLPVKGLAKYRPPS